MNIIDYISEWFVNNRLEAFASIIGLINIYFGIKEKPVFWLIGLFTSTMFFILYFQNRLYAYMTLQIYYFGLGVFGIYYWMKGGKKDKKTVKISNISLKHSILVSLAFLIIWAILIFILKNYTDSDIPVLDAFVSSSAIIAAYMLVRKYIENWIVWIVSDIITMYMLWHKSLYAAFILQNFYFIFAFVGYFQWRKTIKNYSNP